MTRLALLPTLLLLLAGAPVAAAQAGLGYDLIETNAAPGPLNPGLNYFYAQTSTTSVEGTGLAVADVNEDGFQDLLICGTEGKANEFYVNNGNGTFAESAAAYGIQETSKRRGNALFFDLDNDGDLDLITLGYPGIGSIDLDLYSLYRNDGAPAYGFTDITTSSGGFVLGPTTDSTTAGIPGGAAAADYDRDGFLDVIVSYWNENVLAGNYGNDQLRLWHNVANPVPPEIGQTDWTPRLLVDATLAAGLDSIGDSENWMPTFTDFDRDGWPDLHLNVELGPDELRLNLKNGTFGPNIATSIGMNFNSTWPVLPWGNEMGTALGDYDNDGDIDAYLTNTSLAGWGGTKEDAFYRNDSDLALGGLGLKFTYIGAVSGVGTNTTIRSGWGANFADLDNDGDRELLNVRGHGTATAPNYVWTNLYPLLAADGMSVSIQDASASCPEFSDLSTIQDNARALVSFDYDNDGDLDVIYTRSPKTVPPMPITGNVKTAFFVNTLSNGKLALQVSLENTGGSLNTVGARVFLRTGGVGGPVQMAEVTTGSSFLCQEPSRLHFGLGAAAAADWIAIRWFDGTQQVVRADGGPPLVGLRSVTHAANDATGDLDGDLDTDAADLALFVTSLVNAAAVDAVSPDWPWEQLADADGNGVRDTRDFALLRAIVGGPFADLGNGLAGTPGLPTLTGSGPLTTGSPVTIALDNAQPGSNWWLVIGFDLLAGNLKGGVLVPTLNVLIGPLPTLGGSLPLGGTWPALPPGLQIFLQGWVQDPGGPSGFSATNGLGALTP